MLLPPTPIPPPPPEDDEYEVPKSQYLFVKFFDEAYGKGAGEMISGSPYKTAKAEWPLTLIDAAKWVYRGRGGTPSFFKLDDYFRNVLRPFAMWLVNNGYGEPKLRGDLLVGWMRANPSRFQNLVAICREIENSSYNRVFSSPEEHFRLWPRVRAEVVDNFYPNQVVDQGFLDLLEEARVVLCWKWDLWEEWDASDDPSFVTVLPPRPKQDPRTFVIQPDQLKVDDAPEGEEIKFSTVPDILVDQED